MSRARAAGCLIMLASCAAMSFLLGWLLGWVIGMVL